MVRLVHHPGLRRDLGTYAKRWTSVMAGPPAVCRSGIGCGMMGADLERRWEEEREEASGEERKRKRERERDGKRAQHGPKMIRSARGSERPPTPDTMIARPSSRGEAIRQPGNPATPEGPCPERRNGGRRVEGSSRSVPWGNGLEHRNSAPAADDRDQPGGVGTRCGAEHGWGCAGEGTGETLTNVRVWDVGFAVERWR